MTAICCRSFCECFHTIYHRHVRTYENTLITMFFGLHWIKLSSGQKVTLPIWLIKIVSKLALNCLSLRVKYQFANLILYIATIFERELPPKIYHLHFSLQPFTFIIFHSTSYILMKNSIPFCLPEYISNIKVTCFGYLQTQCNLETLKQMAGEHTKHQRQ